MKFTDKHLKSLKAKEKKYTVTSESESRGVGRLQLVIYPSGSKKFQFQYFYNGRKRLLIGSYPSLTLAAARKEFLRLSDLVQNNKDPREAINLKNKIVEENEYQRTFIEMVDDFIKFIKLNWAESTIKRTVYSINSDLKPYVNNSILPCDFTEHEARLLIYKIYNRGAQNKALVFRSTLLSLFKFAIDFDNSPERYGKPNFYNVKHNVIRDINLDVKKNAKDRWLSEDEIYNIWHAKDLAKPTQLYCKLALCLAGQRINEVYKAKASEFDFEKNIFTIPKERIKIKSRGDHVVPISDLAKEILIELFATRGESGYLWSHYYKKDEPAAISTLRMAIIRWCEKHEYKLFTAQDIRRTCKTQMGIAGISKYNRDLLQQHSKRDVSAIHYDRYDYLREKRAAIDEWTQYLKSIVKNNK